MTQADLVRLYFNKESAYNSWDYCFNQQCPLAQECAHYLSVTYKKPEQTKGYAIYPDAYHDNKCEQWLFGNSEQPLFALLFACIDYCAEIMNFIMRTHPLHFATSCTSLRDFIHFIELTHTAELAE